MGRKRTYLVPDEDAARGLVEAFAGFGFPLVIAGPYRPNRYFTDPDAAAEDWDVTVFDTEPDAADERSEWERHAVEQAARTIAREYGGFLRTAMSFAVGQAGAMADTRNAALIHRRPGARPTPPVVPPPAAPVPASLPFTVVKPVGTTTCPATAFPEVFDQMRLRPIRGRTVAAGMARAYAPTDPLSKLEDSQLAMLYRWMLEQYPPEGDSFEPGFHFTSAEQDTRFWRERAAGHLVEPGTLAAIDELAVLADEHPHRPWLRRMLATAQERHRTAFRSPPRLNDVRAMAEDVGRRYARDENDLQEAILEQLSHLQERMRGKTPEAYFLWNEHRVSKTDSRWRPKYEPELSDYVAIHLETHLRHVFTNREVELERTTSTGMGERVDLLCQAFDPTDRDRAARYQIVIEVKGCWNERLEADLHDQLSADYMPKVGTHHGIYLVGYFPKSQWDPQESRYKKTRERSAQQLKANLDVIAHSELAQTQNRISVFVLDLSRPEPRRLAA